VTKIILNGREVEADPTKPLIHACHENEAEVPHYCYHPGLSPVGSCRICQVEVQQGQMPPRVVAACRTPIAEGMVVNTETEQAHETRRECLEFLLKNHPLDCPICDKAGECTLQDYSFDEGQGMGRTSEPRRKLEKRKDLGDVILLDQERCILCSRCVRFMEEVPKTPQLTIGLRGAHSVVETFADRPLTGNYQGNLADVCPVGALTLKKFRFQARVWNLQKTASTCGECSRGCSTTVEVLRSGEVKRFRPRYNEDVNGYWMCDTGRFAFDYVGAPERIEGALTRRGDGNYESVPTNKGLDIVRDVLRTREKTTFVLSPFVTQEEARLIQELAQQTSAEVLFVSPPPNDLKDDLLHTGDPCPNRRGLTDLGIEGVANEELAERLTGRDAAIFIGDMVGELSGEKALMALTTSMRVVFFSAHLVDVPATDVCIGIANYVERTGTWVNVDGHAGRIAAARPAPNGVWSITRSLETLIEALTAQKVAE